MTDKSKLLFSVTKKDLKIEYFSGTGKGGQHRNRHKNCVRLFHPDSRAMSTGQSHKERQSNIKEALKNLIKRPKFILWHNRMVNEHITGRKIEDIVDDLMKPQNLKIEIKDGNGKWTQQTTETC